MVLSENLKKVMLAGIGTIASTAEKSRELLSEMVKKGEITMEQASILNGDLAKNLKEKSGIIKEKSIIIKEKSQGLKDTILTKASKKFTEDDFSNFIADLSPEQLELLKEQIAQYELALQSEEEEVEAAEAEETDKAVEEAEDEMIIEDAAEDEIIVDNTEEETAEDIAEPSPDADIEDAETGL